MLPQHKGKPEYKNENGGNEGILQLLEWIVEYAPHTGYDKKKKNRVKNKVVRRIKADVILVVLLFHSLKIEGIV